MACLLFLTAGRPSAPGCASPAALVSCCFPLHEGKQPESSRNAKKLVSLELGSPDLLISKALEAKVLQVDPELLGEAVGSGGAPGSVGILTPVSAGLGGV